MSSQFSGSRFAALYVLPVLAIAALIWAVNNPNAGAQANNGANGVNNLNNGNNFFGRQVGGVAINVDGVVARSTVEDGKLSREKLKRIGAKVPGDISKPAEMRMVSLKGLEAACREAVENKSAIPEELMYLSGIQRIQYVFVYPEANDIVLAGPGEGWRVDEVGNVVGVTTGLPVIHLDDLLVALRTVGAAKQEGISCSIDPTPEGRRRLEVFLKKQKQFSQAAVAGMEQALGPQTISVTGVPAESHFARVLVAADFQMKRLAMGLEPAPIADLPSFIDLLKTHRNSKLANMMPRWWLACNYEPLARSEDGFAWELRGPGVKALTEDDFVEAGGKVKGSGHKNPVAEEWADKMTKKYGELSTKLPVFGDLRNLMDLCVVSALIHKEDLCGQADCQLPLLTSADSPLQSVAFNPPKTVATQCSFLKAGKEWIITASGGVQIESFAVVQRAAVNSPQLPKVRTKAVAPQAGKNWYWN